MPAKLSAGVMTRAASGRHRKRDFSIFCSPAAAARERHSATSMPALGSTLSSEGCCDSIILTAKSPVLTFALLACSFTILRAQLMGLLILAAMVASVKYSSRGMISASNHNCSMSPFFTPALFTRHIVFDDASEAASCEGSLSCTLEYKAMTTCRLEQRSSNSQVLASSSAFEKASDKTFSSTCSPSKVSRITSIPRTYSSKQS